MWSDPYSPSQTPTSCLAARRFYRIGAADRGCRVFDFGRSKEGTGAYSFKKNWGFTPTPLNYEFKLRVGDTIPDVNPLNPKYRLMIGTWKRLPLPVANLLGPMLVRNLG